jgi:regulator of RNase E activity RraA
MERSQIVPTDEHADFLRRAESLPTTLLCDIARDNGYPNTALSTEFHGICAADARVAGWAYTFGGREPEPDLSGPDHLKAQAIDAMRPDSIGVWAGGQMHGVCAFGDLLALGMKVRGVRGAIVDGGVRDVEDLEESRFPVFARYRTPRASTGHWRVSEVQVVVRMPGARGEPVRVRPGDLVVADANGVVCIPRVVCRTVVEQALAHQSREGEIRERILAGESLDDLLNYYGRL